MFDSSKYDINEEANVPQIVYGPPSFIEEDPVVFKAWEGGYGGPNVFFSIEKEDNIFLFKTYCESYNLADSFLEVKEVDENSYNAFIDSIKKATEGWNPVYDNLDILDGTQWSIFLENEKIKYSGSNSFPETYSDVMKLIQAHFPSIPAEYNIIFEKKKYEDFIEKKYDINPKDNIPQKVYGVPRPNTNIIGLTVELKNKSSYYVFSFKCINDKEMQFLLAEGKEINQPDILKKCKMAGKNYFDNLIKNYQNISKNWKASYTGTKDITWAIKEQGEMPKKFFGNGEVPENWIQFIDLLMEYEKLYEAIK